MRPLPKRFSPKPIQRFLLSKLASAVRHIYNFDGVDDRGQLAFRAIDPDRDIDIEFRTTNSIRVSGASQVIVSQCISSTQAIREFLLFFATNGNMVMIVGGNSVNFTPSVPLLPGRVYRVLYVGSLVQVFIDGLLVSTWSGARGTAREPRAPTLIGCAVNNTIGSYAFYLQGQIYDVKIGGTKFLNGESKQEIQLPDSPVFGPNIVDISSVIWDVTSTSTSTSGGELSYVAFDSWGQRPFRIPIQVQPNIPYLFEMDVVSGYLEGEAVRLILNDKLADGAPHVTPNSWPTTPAVNFDLSSPHYGSYVVIGRPRNGKVRGMFYIPNPTNLNWFMSVRLVQTQNGRNIRLRNLSIRPLLTMSGGNLWASRNLMAANAATVDTNTSGSSWVVTRTGPAIPADAGRSGDFSGLEIGAMYMLTFESSSPIYLAVYDGAFVLKDFALANVLLFRASSVNKLYVCPVTQNLDVTVSNPRLFKIDTLCNPLQLINSNPDRWEDASYLRAFSFNDPRNTQYLPLI